MQLGPSGLAELEQLHMEPNSEHSISQSPYSIHTVFACMSHTCGYIFIAVITWGESGYMRLA